MIADLGYAAVATNPEYPATKPRLWAMLHRSRAFFAALALCSVPLIPAAIGCGTSDDGSGNAPAPSASTHPPTGQTPPDAGPRSSLDAGAPDATVEDAASLVDGAPEPEPTPPPEPSDPTFTSTTTTATLSWTSGGGGTKSFLIAWGGTVAPATCTLTPKQDYSFTPTFTFKNLTPGKTYPYRLCAVGGTSSTTVVSVGITSSFTTMP